MAPRGWELLGDFFDDKIWAFEKPVTFRKLNIFWYIFFRNISTWAENHESRLTHDITAPSREVSTKKVVKQKNQKFIFEKSENPNFKNGAENIQKTSEIKFLDHVGVGQQSCRPECNQSSRKSNPDRKCMIFLQILHVYLVTFLVDTSLGDVRNVTGKPGFVVFS